MLDHENSLLEARNAKLSREFVKKLYNLLAVPIDENRKILNDVADQIELRKNEDCKVIREIFVREMLKMDVAITEFFINFDMMEEKHKIFVEKGGDATLADNVKKLMLDMKKIVTCSRTKGEYIRNKMKEDAVEELLVISPDLIDICNVLKANLDRFHEIEKGLDTPHSDAGNE